jgi:hypothetical protein
LNEGELSEVLCFQLFGWRARRDSNSRPSDSKSEGRFGKQDFRYVAEEDINICPTGEKLAHHFTNENGLVLRRYWTNACRTCARKAQCTAPQLTLVEQPA